MASQIIQYSDEGKISENNKMTNKQQYEFSVLKTIKYELLHSIVDIYALHKYNR